jgi:hypothetical protein
VRKVFLRVLENRNADTLSAIIQQHVAPGSVIITDCWRGYRPLSSLGFSHMTVNHSETFVDHDTGACTNMVEGTNCAIKSAIPVRNRTNNCEDRLCEFVWRRKNQEKLWDALIEAMTEVVYI